MKKIYLKSLFIGMLTVLITTSCGKDEPEPEILPVADFEFMVEENTGNVTFTNKSENAVSYEWEFGDNKISSEKDPVHVYEASGSYEVILTAINDKGSTNSKSKTVEINILVAKPEIDVTIDGTFADWDNIPWREDIKLGGDLQKIKIAATDETVYIFMQGTKSLYTNANKNAVFMDLDYNSSTGDTGNARLKDGKGGADAMQQIAGFHVWGWRSEQSKIGWDWIKDGWIEWISKVVGDNTYMEWKLDLKYARAQVLTNNEVFQIPSIDYSQFATSVSSEHIRLYIWLRDAAWAWVGEAPAQGEEAFTVTLNEYVEKD